MIDMKGIEGQTAVIVGKKGQTGFKECQTAGKEGQTAGKEGQTAGKEGQKAIIENITIYEGNITFEY